MKLRTSAGAVALALTAALTLTACGDDGADSDPQPEESSSSAAATEAPAPTAEDVAALEAVTVEGEPGEEPKLTFEAPLEVSAPTTRVVDEGDGDALAEGSRVTMQYIAYDGNAERLGSTWETDSPETFILGDQNYGLLTDALDGQKVGARIMVANSVAGNDGTTQTVLNFLEITDTAPTPSRAEGTAVEPAEGLPTVTLADDGAPSIEIPEGYEAPDELVSQPLIKGDGEKVTADQQVYVQYSGWTLDGEQFDSSWERGVPFTFSMQGGVIPGWIDGVKGQPVGSQLLLVIPADQAYGAEDDGSHELAGKPLVFVVDVLAAW
ncbi:FKBP-type peptidyl-prolyl cis-trans isomerase [Isoptericola sp. NEAU-Y5]|uniref:peptidylprolyl isomerase n=1 Tax=Isoptericola luteus TaxID=2879484 RepID=A0ABS7ZJJ9_9MICO|nr:FKBP-type peptidyl-prolyl cis-trans isomerase [Isoptericola sp. NEAU-Y5]MCA5893784.1 FKBP-type peptidyl-prolyl cis-trans isomerase [Isoptericola sp. NEAU-Y5]